MALVKQKGKRSLNTEHSYHSLCNFVRPDRVDYTDDIILDVKFLVTKCTLHTNLCESYGSCFC